ncbi:hypothetical protein FOC4_g10003671 [Fusarium odoratissimum]|uniref:Uncharacterized protein n=1 Tax=Fusarium oxysporum f. sp. cubense (strain race 4) TaxID=2502994 RepID=N1RXY6_FUSC4|nr:hypothetical protein FOC4_g10003670 [Fusarium odoratissimum]EMT67125.1 hypothetical protein FOC4_g10003671 [Fusarium odoratissimum]
MSSESQPTAEVTGPTAFWILASLASAAAAQPSGNRKRDNDLFGGNVDIVRSIPAVCLIDSIFDLFVLAGGISRFLSSHNSTQQTRRNSPKATGLVIRLALTIFTVLPQTIKVFSLQGVPATQICAFIFFFANITKLLVSICGWEPEGILQEKDDSTSIDVLLSSVLQAPFEFWIWFNISRQASFKLSTEVENLCEWAAMLLESIGTLLAFLLSRGSLEDEQSGQSEVQFTSGEDTAEEQDETREQMFAGHPEAWLGRIGVAPDQLVMRGLTLNTTASTSITLTLFNFITTVFYYLVYFDGTGTENPSWTSVLG